MSACIPTFLGSFGVASNGKMMAGSFGTVGKQRLPTDPLFYADLVLDNIIAGSRYRVTRKLTGAELATGVAAGTTETISGVPCYALPMQVDITVRNASGTPAYRIFDTVASMGKGTNNAYILQQADE
jgi:hypothetical protein